MAYNIKTNDKRTACAGENEKKDIGKSERIAMDDKLPNHSMIFMGRRI